MIVWLPISFGFPESAKHLHDIRIRKNGKIREIEAWRVNNKWKLMDGTYLDDDIEVIAWAKEMEVQDA